MRLSGGVNGNKIQPSTSPVTISTGIRRSNDGSSAGPPFNNRARGRQEYSPVKQPPTPTFPASTSPQGVSPPPHSTGLGAPPKLVHPFWSKVYQELLHHLESGLPAKEFSVSFSLTVFRLGCGNPYFGRILKKKTWKNLKPTAKTAKKAQNPSIK